MDLKGHTLALMKLLRQNLYDFYKLEAVGRLNMYMLDQMVQYMQKWVVVMDLYTEKKETEGSFFLVLARAHDFGEKFVTYKERAKKIVDINLK